MIEGAKIVKGYRLGSESLVAEWGNARRIEIEKRSAQTCLELQAEPWLAPTVLDKAAVSSGMETGKISLSPRFFENELKAYSDWREAFWRELVQNSVDAGCRNINIGFAGSSDEPEVIFSDDGPGMSQQTLRDVYFQLGASTKGSEDIGGFGRARMLTCFAHDRYWVKSRDYIATGRGASFQIAANPDSFTHGCEIGVRLLNSGGDIAMKSRLVSFLSTCQLDCRVLVEGEEFTTWAYRYRKAGELSFAAIHVNRSQSPQILVRVNGVAMFTRWTSAKARIILEIPPDVARHVLTSNRDGLRHRCQEEFDRYLEKLSADCSSAVKERFAPLKTFFGQATRTIRRKSAAPEPCAPMPEPLLVPNLTMLAPLPRLGPPTDVFFNPPDSSLPEFVLYTDCQSRKLRAAAKRFTPQAIAGTRRERLLSGWTCACEIALGALLEITGGGSIDFAPGFVFSDDAKAVCISGDGIHSLLLRPVDENGRSAYSVSAPSTAHQLLAAAAHEAAHVVHSCHNEDFAATLTELFGKVSAHAKLVRVALRGRKSQCIQAGNTYSEAA